MPETRTQTRHLLCDPDQDSQGAFIHLQDMIAAYLICLYTQKRELEVIIYTLNSSPS